jgi:serine/threonine-protein kinase
LAFSGPLTIGPYHASTLLGTGSYGDVYAVTDADNHEFALKWLKEGAERQGRLRFENEIWALRRLEHPSIPKVIEEGEHAGRPYLVMTRARGSSLRVRLETQLRTGGIMPEIRTLHVAIAILDAVQHMQGLGISHRDIKDANIVATSDTQSVVLIDFGFCRGPGQPNEAETFWYAGAGRFSPPSKIENPRKVHPNHDVFAVGVVLYLMLTNKYPWDASSPAELRRRMLRVRPRLICDINPFASKDTSLFVDGLLTTDDDARPRAGDALTAVREMRDLLESRYKAPRIATGRSIEYPALHRNL